MSGPLAGTSNSAGISSTRSGVPSLQPVVNFGMAGIFERSPSGIPPFTHVAIAWIWASVSRRSSANSP